MQIKPIAAITLGEESERESVRGNESAAIPSHDDAVLPALVLDNLLQGL